MSTILRRTAIGYAQAILWLLHNDDNYWVLNDEPLSVAASLCADIYQRTDNELRADLAKALKKEAA